MTLEETVVFSVGAFIALVVIICCINIWRK
jgi:hypothetical protein